LQIEITHSCADYPSATATAPAPGTASPLGNHLSGVSVRHWHPMTTGYRNPRHGCNLVRISWGLIKIANYEFIKADQIPRRGPLRRLSLRPENALHWPETAGFRVTGIGTGTETGNGIRIPRPSWPHFPNELIGPISNIVYIFGQGFMLFNHFGLELLKYS